MLVAVLDTNVLWPSLRRDFLLSLHIEGAYRALWSEAILDELEHHERIKLHRRGWSQRAAARRARVLVSQMREHFDDSNVTGWEVLEGTYGLPDPDDEHVVAAAVVGRARLIVTENSRDYPVELMPTGITVVGAATFAGQVVRADLGKAVAALDEIVARSGRFGARLTRDGVLETLEGRYGMTDAVRAMQEYLGS